MTRRDPFRRLLWRSTTIVACASVASAALMTAAHAAPPVVQRPTIQRPSAPASPPASPTPPTGAAPPGAAPTPPSLPAPRSPSVPPSGPPALPPERSPSAPPSGPPSLPPERGPAVPPAEPPPPVESAPPDAPGASPTAPAEPPPRPAEPPPRPAEPPPRPAEPPPPVESAPPSSRPQPAPEGPPEPEPIAAPPPPAATPRPPPAAKDPPRRADPSREGPEPASDETADGEDKPTKKDPKDRKNKKDPKDRERAEADDDDGKDRKKKPFKHTGLILEGKIGLLGCFRTHCRAQYHHDSAPGLALGGFVGGNLLFGFLDVGLEASWGRLRPRAYSGRNVLNLYSVDPARLQQVVAEETGAPVPVDFSSLTLGEIQSRAIHAGPTIRVHVIPRGRVSAYVGAGLHYQQWRNDYKTVGGDMRIGWHGLSVPLTAGVGGYVIRRLAIGAEFSYIHALFLAAGLRHPDLNLVTPLALIESAAQEAGTNLRQDLPTFWTLVLSARVRI